MLWQMVVVVSLILLSAAYLGWQSFKNWNSKDDCGGCHCSSKKKQPKSANLIVESELTARLKHQRLDSL